MQTIITDVEFRHVDAKPGAGFYSGQRAGITSMIHSDKSKPQGISATARIRFTNVDRNVRILHNLSNTGAARYFNFIDWDGSVTGANGSRIIGSAHEGDWWRIDPGCVKEVDWNVWVCPKDPQREIANLQIMAPVPVPNPFGSGTVPFIDEPAGTDYPPDDEWKVGNMTLWGPGIPTGRKTAVTRNPGVTGVSKMGWHMWFHAGTPKQLKIAPYVLPDAQFIMFSVRFPTSCAVEVWISHDYVNGGASVWKNVTLVSTFDQVLQGNGTQWFRDAEFVFLKIRIFEFQGSNPSFSSFSRGGIKIWDITKPQAYNLKANCGASTPDFLPVTNAEPVGYWV